MLAAMLAATTAWAGGSGLNVIVVVNQNSTNSVRLGNDYCEQRGVPPQNLLRITNWTGGNIYWQLTNFQSFLFQPLQQMVASRGLTDQAQVVLLSMDIPFTVLQGPYYYSPQSVNNSTTSVLFYGFKTDTKPPPGYPNSCSLPDASSNSYAFSELPFPAAGPTTAVTNSYLAMMLTDSNLAGAELVLRRGVASDSTYPTQTVYLEQTGDVARTVRYWEFDNAVLDARVRGGNSPTRIYSGSTSFTNLLGLMTGLEIFTLPSAAFVPGAMADSLTSYGGFIFDPTIETIALVFLEAGATGSYGTVTEPCAYIEKFPSPMDYFYQMRGFSLAEAYYQSVLNPYQGLMLGEPLSAPFARPGLADWSSLADGAVLSGLTPLAPVFFANATNLPLGQVDLFVDGTFSQTITNVPPAAGNVLSVTINGTPAQYVVPPNATLASVATGLAGVLNAESNTTRVIAYPIGDRLELDGIDPGTPGSNLNVSVGQGLGTAAQLTTQLLAARPAFLDSMATGYVGFVVSNTPLVGDWVQMTFVKTNGTRVQVGVTNMTAGLTNNTALIQSLYNQINGTPALQTSDGVAATDFQALSSPPVAGLNIFARAPGFPQAQIQVTLTASPGLVAAPSGTTTAQDNLSDLMPRNHLYLTAGAIGLPVNYLLDTTGLTDGFHTLTAVAYEGSSVRTQTQVSRTVVIQNTPLSATLMPIIAATNTTLEGLLRFAVSANTNNLARLELFSTGGSIGVVSNQASAVFTTSFATLGGGLHPFYAVVTDLAGHQYQTQTEWFRFPLIALSLVVAPGGGWTLSWPALPGQAYDILTATSLAGPYQTVGTITPTNSPAHWPIAATNPAAFYRVHAGL